MQDLTGFDPAFGTFSCFLRRISGEVGNVDEVKVGTANGAVCIFVHYVFCGADELGELDLIVGDFFVVGKIVSLIHDHLPHFLSWAIVVVADKDLFGTETGF